jgi:hypothetical protein
VVLQNVLLDLLTHAFKDLTTPKAASQENYTIWDTLMRLLEVHPGLWPKFLMWGTDPDYASSRIKTKCIPRLTEYFKTLAGYFDTLSDCILRGHVTVATMNSVIESYSILWPAWSVKNSPLRHQSENFKLRDELLNCWSEANTMSKVMQSLMPECEELKRYTAY